MVHGGAVTYCDIHVFFKLSHAASFVKVPLSRSFCQASDESRWNVRALWKAYSLSLNEG